MRAIVLSHRSIAHELGHLEPWLDSWEVERRYREDCRFSEIDLASDPARANPSRAELLIVLGSPGSVADGYCPAPARAEVELVRTWIAQDRPYLGICFGAQVLALALGGSVRRMPVTFRAYGELPVTADAPPELAGPWAIWHEDAITIPPHVTSMSALPHADIAFRHGRAWGLQPHVEVSHASLTRMLDALGADPGDAQQVLAGLAAAEADADPPAARMGRLLEAFTRASLG